MGAPDLMVEMWLGGAWVDLVAAGRVELSAAPVTITRGRANEYGQVNPGQCSFVLSNDDGAFTPELAASPYRSSLTLHRPVRVSVRRPDSTWSVRFSGYVDDDPVELDDPTGAVSRVTVTAVDRLALMGLKQLRCQRDELILALAPRAYYPLDDQSGATQANDLMGGPRLLPTQVGSGGTLEFGAEGGPQTAEGAGSVSITRASATAGLYLLSDGALPSLGTEWSMISTQAPTTSGYLWQVKQGTFIIALYWSSSTSKYSVRQYNGSAWSTLATSSAATTGRYTEVVTVTATQVVLRSDATRTAGARAAATFSSPTLYVGYCSDATSGFDDITTAIMSAVAIVPGAMAMAAADTLASAINSPASATTDGFLQTVMGWAGMSTSVSHLGDHPSLGYVATGQQSPQALADLVGQGANGRFACMSDGSLCWVDGSYAPALIELDAEAVTRPLRWARDRSAYVTDVTTSLPSGGSYTYSALAAGLVRESKSITGVLSTDQACKDAAAFIVAGSSLSPRLSQCTFDLLTQPDNTATTDILSLDIGSQFALVGLPPQIPDSQSLVVEGMAETLGLDVWSVTVNTSPSSQSLPPTGWYFAWVNGATTYIDDGLGYIANL